MKKLLTFASCLLLCLLTTASVFAADTSRSSEILSYEVEPGKNIYYYPAYGEITDCDDTITDLVIPSEIDGVTITTIGRNAFNGNTNLKNVTIPNTVTTIEIAAFEECRNLNDINIPNSVTTIKDSAFRYCTSFVNVNIPDSVTYLGNNAFEYCENLSNIKLPNGITQINSRTFSSCQNLNNIIIPNNVTKIGTYAFANTGLLNINIPGNVKQIEYYAFSSCDNLKNIIINNGVINIETSVFSNCEYLTTITLPKSLEQINSYTFEGCWRLTEILVDSENENYTSVEGILFNKDLTRIVSYPEGKRNTSYNIPNTVTVIEYHAFSGCEYLKDIYYPGSEYQWQQIAEYGYPNIIIPETTTVHCLGASVTGIKLNQTELVLPVNDTVQLIATVEPENAACKDIEWNSNNWCVYVDNNGLMTARAAGTAIITAKTLDGEFVAECIVTVTEKETPTNPSIPDEPNIPNKPDKPTEPDTPIIYTLTLNANGGYITFNNQPNLTVDMPQNSVYGLPQANRTGYTLQHWSDGENKYNAGTWYEIKHDTTLIAIWEENTNKPSSTGGSSSNGGGRKPTTNTNQPDTSTEKPTTPTASQSGTLNPDNINSIFPDVKSEYWYAEYVAYVYNKGMMKGAENGNFEPNEKTTRGMIVTMLYRLEGEPNTDNTNFNDVQSGQWFSNAIAWASANGVVNGYADGTFAPNDDITREQLAAILYRYAQAKGYDTSLAGNIASFSDAIKVSSWATDAIAWAVGESLMNGDNGALRPQGSATRAEVAAMLMRFCENIAK